VQKGNICTIWICQLVLIIALGITGTCIAANDGNYEIVNETYVEKKIMINYPQIHNLNDDDKQTIINQLLKNEALAACNYPETDGLAVTVNYTISWKSANLLSIQYRGVRFFKGGPHPVNEFSTINVDINKGSKIELKDIVVIDEDFAIKAKAGEFKAVDPIIKEKQKFSNEELIWEFSNVGYFYFTNDYLGVSTSVPHAAGDYVIFEVKYQDIAENVKTENEVWKDFFPNKGEDRR